MVRAVLLPAAGQPHGPDLIQLLDLLDRHCLAPDGSLLVKSTHLDLVQAREEMGKERLRYFEAMALYCESLALVEEYHQALSVANAGGIRDLQAMFSQLGLRCVPQVYEALEQRLVVAEAAQRLRLPLVSKDGEVPDEDLEKWSIISDKWSIISRSSFDSTSTTSVSTNTTVTSISTNPSTAIGSGGNNVSEAADLGIGGTVNRFLGLTPALLRQGQLQRVPFAEDSTDYQMALIPEIETRLRIKCEKLTSFFEADESDSSGQQTFRSSRLSERVKWVVEAIAAGELTLLEDLFSADRKFSEYYNVLEQILGVLLRLVKEFKLTHQFQYDGMRKSWLCKRCQTMNTKLRVLEHLLLRDTYTQESIPALHKIRGHLVDATEEATAAYNRAVTRLREYQGVDQYFDDIARRYHDLVTKLESIQWTIRQVEMDLNNAHDHP